MSENYTVEQNRIIKKYVGAVFKMYPDYHNNLSEEKNFLAYCRMYADDILSFNNHRDRLEKLKKLVACQNMNGMVGNYKNAIHALAVACGDMDKLNHDYRIAYPSGQGGTGALKAIENQQPIDEAKRLENIKRFEDEMKDLFSGVKP